MSLYDALFSGRKTIKVEEQKQERKKKKTRTKKTEKKQKATAPTSEMMQRS